MMLVVEQVQVAPMLVAQAQTITALVRKATQKSMRTLATRYLKSIRCCGILVLQFAPLVTVGSTLSMAD
jgi:hypothetical protein